MVSLSTRLNNYSKQYRIFKQNKDIDRFVKRNKVNMPFNNYSKHIFISGEPRGGTTWLMELLMQPNDCLIWEPLHLQNLQQYNPEFYKALGILPYIPENETWNDAREYFKKLFSGELPYGLEINRQYHIKNLNACNNILFKFCRANMLLPWLTKEFPEIKPIYLIRHPLSVISSQFRHSAFNSVGTIHNLFEVRTKGNPLYTDIFEKHANKINAIKSRESMFANWWAIQNSIPLNARKKNWLTVSYERLYLNPIEELDRISDYIRIRSTYNIEAIKSPSSTTKSGSGILEKKSQLANFKRHLTNSQIKEILDIIESYEITQYNDEYEPKYNLLGY